MSQQVTIRIPLFLATRLKMASAEMEGTILEQNSRAVQFEGYAVLRKSKQCLRCGRDIASAISQLAGFGPECSAHIGVPREFNPEDIDAIREAAKAKTRWTGWLPKDKIEILERAEDGTLTQVADHAADPAANATLNAARREDFTPQLYQKEDRLFFKVPFSMNQEVRDKIPMTPRFNSDEMAWSYPATPDIALAIMGAFYETRPEITPEVNDLLHVGMKKEKAQQFKTAEELPPVPTTKHAAWLHQQQAFWFAKELPGVMLAMDMGTGKSKVAVDLVINNGWMKTLIICPVRVVAVWPKEFEKHGGREVLVVPLDNENWTVAQKTEHAAKMIRLAEARGIPVVIAISYESSWREPFGPTRNKRSQITAKGWAIQQDFDCVILDESHKIKDPSSKAGKFAVRIGQDAKQRMCLTGTPMPHSPLDAFMQYQFLDPTIFGTNHAAFKARYAKQVPVRKLNDWEKKKMAQARAAGQEWLPPGPKKVVGIRNEEELNRKFYSIAFRVEKRDVLDLPPVTHLTQPTSLSSKARKIYQALEKEMYAEIENGPKQQVPVFDGETGQVIGYDMKPSSVSISNALTKLLRLQQITSGYIQDDNGTEVQVDTGKEDALESILDGLATEEPVVVFCKFTHDLQAVQRVAEKMGRRYGELSGNKNDLVRACMPEDKDIMGIQIQSGGAGIDLTRAAYAIYYSVGYSLGDYEQSLARIDRPGQTRPVTNYHIITQGTVDVKVYQALSERKKVVDYVLGLDSGESTNDAAGA